MDLDSPFEKVALIRGEGGEIEKRAIKKAKKIGASMELENLSGAVALLPAQEVLAIVPQLPPGEITAKSQDIDKVLNFLERMPPDLAQSAGVDRGQIEKWKKIRETLVEKDKQKEEEERKRQEAEKEKSNKRLAKEIEDWMAEAKEFQVSRTEKELAELRLRGEKLARQSPKDMGGIVELLAVLSQVQPKEKGEALPDLGKLNEIQPRLIPDDLLGWLGGGVVTFSFFGLLFGLGFLSSSFTRFKEGVLLGGVVFGLCGVGLLGGLAWTWMRVGISGESVTPDMDPKMQELGIYLKNRTKPVYYFPQRQFSFSFEEWRSGILGYLPASEEAMGLFKIKLREGSLFLTDGSWIWRQPLTVLGIPLPFTLTFEGKNPDLKDWENPAILKVYLGRWSLPEVMGGLVKDSALSIWQQGLSSAGLAGVKLDQNDKGQIVITVPAAGVRPKFELAKEEERKEAVDLVKPGYKKKISAEELAQEFKKGNGKEFLGKFILLEGFVERVESGSEISGAPSASKQGKPFKELGASTFGQTSYDSFYLQTESQPIRCLIKSELVFVQDERKDIYLGPSADTVSSEPFIKRGYRVKFLTEGRVEEVNKFGEIEVYGIRLDPEKLKEQIEVFDPNQVREK